MPQNTVIRTEKTFTQFELMNLIFDSDLFEKFKLKASTRILLMTICRYYPNIYPSTETLRKKAGIISKETLNDSLKELKEKGLIIYSVGNKKSNNYKLTALFFSSLKTEPDRYVFSDSMCTESVHKQTNNKTNKKEQNFSLKNSLPEKQIFTEFQKKYEDVFKILSEYELNKYKKLKGYEKEDWLKSKRREIFQQKQNEEFQQKIKENKQNASSPLDLTKEQATEYLNNLPKMILKNSQIAKALIKKWNLVEIAKGVAENATQTEF